MPSRMRSRFSLIAILVALTINLINADGDGHRHHVIIHVPYKIHTIHHTILKHIHHHDKGNDDKYEVIGYTVSKPIDLGGHHFGGQEQLYHHHQELAHHDFAGGNELGHGHDWAPSYAQQDYAGANHFEGHVEHGDYAGYD